MRYMAMGLAALLLAGCGDGGPTEPQTWTRTFHVFGTVRSEVDSVRIEGALVSAHDFGFGLGPTFADDTTDRSGNYSMEFTRTYGSENCGFGSHSRGPDPDPSWVPFVVRVEPNDDVHRTAMWGSQIPGATADAIVCGRRENRLDFYLRRLDQPEPDA